MPNRIDAMPAAGITVRYYPAAPAEVDVYVGGWRIGSYKTANGVRNAVARYARRTLWVSLGTVTYGAVYDGANNLIAGDSAEVAGAYPTFASLMDAARRVGGTVIDISGPRHHTLTKP